MQEQTSSCRLRTTRWARLVVVDKKSTQMAFSHRLITVVVDRPIVASILPQKNHSTLNSSSDNDSGRQKFGIQVLSWFCHILHVPENVPQSSDNQHRLKISESNATQKQCFRQGLRIGGLIWQVLRAQNTNLWATTRAHHWEGKTCLRVATWGPGPFCSSFNWWRHTELCMCPEAWGPGLFWSCWWRRHRDLGSSGIAAQRAPNQLSRGASHPLDPSAKNLT